VAALLPLPPLLLKDVVVPNAPPLLLVPPAAATFLHSSASPCIARTCTGVSLLPPPLLLLLLLGVFVVMTKPSARLSEPVVMVPVLSSAMVLQAARASMAEPDLTRMPRAVMAAMAQA
jgi:hypothetical protein